ncbi:MAG: M20/M25/M40 family metallo-hydrolase, partial [Clostridia bacterium]|nr:M20/M25/M40 family metallo-hydrolase [Clostridia bacterium]
AAKYDVEIVVRDSDNEYYKPTSLESDGYKYVRKIVQSVFDYAVAVPFILPAGTDARRFTGLSDSVIRFAPIDIDGQQYASVHSENENINVDKIPLAVKFYKELLRNYK